MSGFSFETTAGASQSTVQPKLVGNNIYSVKFDGCEIKDVQGVKEPDKIYKNLILKFSNDDACFEHTVWEPRPEDHERRENEITNSKTGAKEKIPQPSNVESMLLLFKHAIDSINPVIASKIDKKEQTFGAKSWDDMRTLVSTILNKGKGTPTKIKLLKDKKGEAIFPGFFAGINREGKTYVKNNFIGDKIAFSTYELDRIKKEENAQPARVESFAPSADLGDLNLNLDFNLENV